MKKLFLAICLFVATATTINAQSTSLSGSQGELKIANTDAAGNDTIKIFPRNKVTYIHHTLTDSVTYKITSLSQCSYGDMIVINVTNTAGGTKFKTIPASGFEITGADSVMVITASKRACQVFRFDGVKFIESSIIKQ